MNLLRCHRGLVGVWKLGDSSTEQLIEASVTIWLVVLLLERALVECLQTEGAHEARRMEFPEHCRYASTSDWLRASGTQRSTFSMVMRLTVRQSFVIEKRATLERLTTILKRQKDKRLFHNLTIRNPLMADHFALIRPNRRINQTNFNVNLIFEC